MAVGKFFSNWYHRYFSDPQAILLAILLVVIFGVILVMGGMLAPVIAALVIAYLLEGTVQQLERRNIPRLAAVIFVFLVFLAVLVFLVLGLMPVISLQTTEFMGDLPRMINEGHRLLLRLPELYPQLFTSEQISELTAGFRNSMGTFSRNVLSLSLATIPAIITVFVYLILGPLLVFFFLKDKAIIVTWVGQFLPRDHALLTQIWREMDDQIGNYVRGKFYEIFIVGVVTYITFALLGMSYAPLLAVVVGLSVIVPYIGAAVVTIPVALAGYLQMGWSVDFAWIMIAYAVLQALDGNLLVPLLFSEAVNLHPIAIIVAVLVFGGVWGFWGVFFAIPLATLVKALLNVWPRVALVPESEGIDQA